MALVVKDRVKETATTIGTGAVTLGGAVTGFESFSSALANSDTTYYAISHRNADEWEVGLGTYNTGVLTRTTILESSNSDSAVSKVACSLKTHATHVTVLLTLNICNGAAHI